MKKLLLIITTLICLASYGQRPYSPALLYGQNELRMDVTMLLSIPNDTLRPTAEKITKYHIAIKFGTIYIWDPTLTPPRWVPYGGGGGGPVTWGSLTGSIPTQTDLWNILINKQGVLPISDTFHYWRSDGSLGLFQGDISRDLLFFTFDAPLRYSYGHFYMDKATASIPGYMDPADFQRHDQGYNRSFVSGIVTGTTTKTLSFLKSDGTSFPNITWTDLTGGTGGTAGIVSINTDTTHAVIFNSDAVGTDVGITNPTPGTFTWHWPSSSATARGPLTSTDWNRFNGKIGPSDTSTMLAPYFREVGWGLARTGRIPRLDTSTAGTASLWKIKQMIDSAHNIPNGIYPQWPLFKINDSTFGIKKYIAGTQSGILDSTAVLGGMSIYNNGGLVNPTPRTQINFIPSTGMSINIVDNPSGNIVNVTLASSGGGGGATAFSGLTDVAVSTPVQDQIPVYDTAGGVGRWRNKTPAKINLSAVAGGDLLHYVQGPNDWENFFPAYSGNITQLDAALVDTISKTIVRKPISYVSQWNARQKSHVWWNADSAYYIQDTLNYTVDAYQQLKRNQNKNDSVLLYQLDITKFLGQQGWDTTQTDWRTNVTESLVPGEGIDINDPVYFSATNFAASPLKIATTDFTTVCEYRIISFNSSPNYVGQWEKGTSRYFARSAWFGTHVTGGDSYITTDARGFSPVGVGTANVISPGDIVRIYVRRHFSEYFYTVYNLTKGMVFTGYLSDAMIGENINDVNPGLFLLNAHVVLRSFRIYANEYRPKVLFLGASITQDANSAPNFDSSYIGRIQRKSNLTTAFAGGSGDGLYDTWDRISNTLALKPDIVVIGGDLAYNEIQNGVAYATWQALHKSLVDTFQKQGVFVIVNEQSPASPNTIPDSINNWIHRTYSNSNMLYVMNWDDHTYSATYQADALGHLTDAGAKKYSDNFLRHIQDISGRPTAIPVFNYGVYTPVKNDVANVSSDFIYDAQYNRIGNIVTVSGRIDITSTATTATTYIEMTLPIGSTLTADSQVAGTIACEEDDNAGRVLASVGAGKAKIAIRPRTAGTIRHYQFIYQYQIL